MKKRFGIALVVVLILSVLFCGCSSLQTNTSSQRKIYVTIDKNAPQIKIEINTTAVANDSGNSLFSNQNIQTVKEYSPDGKNNISEIINLPVPSNNQLNYYLTCYILKNNVWQISGEQNFNISDNDKIHIKSDGTYWTSSVI